MSSASVARAPVRELFFISNSTGAETARTALYFYLLKSLFSVLHFAEIASREPSQDCRSIPQKSLALRRILHKGGLCREEKKTVRIPLVFAKLNLLRRKHPKKAVL